MAAYPSKSCLHLSKEKSREIPITFSHITIGFFFLFFCCYWSIIKLQLPLERIHIRIHIQVALHKILFIVDFSFTFEKNVLGTVQCANKLQLSFQNAQEMRLITTLQKQPHNCSFLLLQSLRYVSVSLWSICCYSETALAKQILFIRCLCRGTATNCLLEFTMPTTLIRESVTVTNLILQLACTSCTVG